MGKSHKIAAAMNWLDHGKLFDIHQVKADGSGDHRWSKPTVSPLLRALAARTWQEVTEGAGVVLVDGQEVKPVK